MTYSKEDLKKSSRVKPFVKDWKFVIYSGEAPVFEEKIDVFEISYKDSCLKPITTSGILSIDFIDKNLTMINTGPCRYMALNMNSRPDNTSVMVAYATEMPIAGAEMYVNLLNYQNLKETFIPSAIHIDSFKKLSNSLYVAKVNNENCFIVVE